MSDQLDPTLKSVMERVVEDHGWIEDHHEISWKELVVKVAQLLRDIVTKVYSANLGHVSVDPINATRWTIGEMLENVQRQLLSFQDSPPFSVLRLVERLLEQPKTAPSSGAPVSQTGIETYEVRVRNHIDAEDTTEERTNEYHQLADEDSDDSKMKEPALTDLLAVRFLRSMAQIVYVQSTVDEVNNDLASADVHRVPNDDRASEPPEGIRMTKIEWAEAEADAADADTDTDVNTDDADADADVQTLMPKSPTKRAGEDAEMDDSPYTKRIKSDA